MKFLQDFHVRDVLKGGTQALSLKILATIVGFLVSIILGRFYGPEGMGVYALMLNTILIAATFSTAGLDNAVVKFVSGDLATNNNIGASRTLNTAVLMVLVLAICIVAIIYFGRIFLSIYVLGNELVAPLLGIVSFGIICIALTRMCSAGLRALGNVPAAHVADGVALPSGILVVFLLSKGDGLERVAFSYLAGTVLAVIMGIVFLLYTVKAKQLTNILPNIVVAKRLWSMGWPTLGILLGAYATEVLSTLMLSHFSSIEDVGRFRVAWQIAFLVSFLTMATDSIMSPKISTLYIQGKIDTLARILRFNILLIAFFSILVAFTIVTFSSHILSLFGDGFQEAAPILAILVCGQIINGTLGTAGKVLIMTGHEKKSLLNSLVGVAAIVIFSWLFAPKYGGIGAAMAVTITMSVRCISAMILVRIYLGINMLTGKTNLETPEHNDD